MTETCPGCQGQVNLKRCSGCHKTYYCSTECQQNHWVFHIFECDPHRPINTADYLALAIYQDAFPRDHQTCKDYGFYRAATYEEQANLKGLYTDLIKLLGVQPLRVHKWRVQGVLVDKIKDTFFKLPADTRGPYFPWFLKNKDIIAKAGQRCAGELIREAWLFIGGDPNLYWTKIVDVIKDKPASERDTFLLYSSVLLGAPPSPTEFNIWTDFGFASCTSLAEERQLATQYQKLIKKSTFAEFSDAHKDHRLLDLFHSKEVPVDDSRGHLRDILQSDRKKSVWYLKQIVRQGDSSNWLSRINPSTVLDYGFFISCIGNGERLKLKGAYKAFFDSPTADPMALHEAAMKGEIYNHVSSVVPSVRADEDYKELMMNQYPLAMVPNRAQSSSRGRHLGKFYDAKTDTHVTTFGGVGPFPARCAASKG